MKILGIETSCDETALAVVEASGDKSPRFCVLKNIIASQIDVHKEYGGVVPGLAKREHSRNLIPTLKKVLKLKPSKLPVTSYQLQVTEKILHRYPDLLSQFQKNITSSSKPNVNLIAVTYGPGLEPALWVGVNFARALSAIWDIPLIGVDHMEGHVAVNLLQHGNSKSATPRQRRGSAKAGPGETRNSKQIQNKIQFPAVALAVSGGHTQLILVKDWMSYKLLGETLDDAAGEAFDKVARMLGLPFPGGPHIEKLAKQGDATSFDFPRPMEKSKDYNFSFSGLKTAVRYTLDKMTEKEIQAQKENLAASFQEAATDVLTSKTIKAAIQYDAKTVMLAGGVAANQYLKNALGEKLEEKLPNTQYMVPEIKLATDNGVMIAIAGYLRYKNGEVSNWKTLQADSNKLITE